jgi:hypothetical protein
VGTEKSTKIKEYFIMKRLSHYLSQGRTSMFSNQFSNQTWSRLGLRKLLMGGIFCFAIMGCVASSQAQANEKPRVRPSSDEDCTFNFSSGANGTFLQFCVADTGNITRIETPQTHELVADGGGTDGYGICDANAVVPYFDYGVLDGDSGNWQPPVTLSSTSKSVKIARTTSDGIWTLTQTITLVPATPGIQIQMALKNNTAISRAAYLSRWVDINVDGTVLNDFSATRNTAAGWLPTVPFANNFGVGLQLENSVHSQFGFVSGYAQPTYHGPNPCNFAGAGSSTPVVNIDGSIVMSYVDTIGPGKTKTATMVYRGF